MPVPTCVEDFLTVVRKSELLPAPRLDAFLAETNQTGKETPRVLATRLIEAGLITHFQAEQFLQGKWRGFTIGKYRVLERLGSGGMGTVYLCEHVIMGQKVAVKVLPNSQSENPAALGRFYREARAAAQLSHPNLVKAHDIDQENGTHFLVMEYVDGASLQDIVTRNGPLSILRACHYIRQAAAGLQAAHEVGLIHRDIKPANILLERNGTIRVLDLGLARFKEDQDLLTLKYDEKNVLGTADYVAPEQALNSHEVDIRADLYSLGGTFYFLLTGKPIFPGGKIAQKLIWHQVKQPTPVRDLRPEVPVELQAIIEKMLVKEPAKRYQTPAEVINALKPWTLEEAPLPLAEEIPHLSLAAMNSASLTGPAMPRPTMPARRPIRASATHHREGPITEVAPDLQPNESSGRVSNWHRDSTPADLATPRMMASPDTPTDTANPRPSESSHHIAKRQRELTPTEKAIPPIPAAPPSFQTPKNTASPFSSEELDPMKILEKARQEEREPTTLSPLQVTLITLICAVIGTGLSFWFLNN